MKNLNIGTDGFDLPIDLATGSIALLATKGAGKSYTSAVIVEELIDRGVPCTLLDPTGAHWGLKSSASGKTAGLPVTIFGGDHADIPLEEGAGEVLARAIVEHRISAVLDLSLFRKAQLFRFLTPFLETLYRLNREPMHLVCDEADAYAPQKSWPDVARCLGAMEDIVRRGRKNGIGSTLITQRPASINKDVLTQCDCLMAMRVVHPKDLDPVMEWVRVHADPVQAEEMLKSLPSLPTGTVWIWAPSYGILKPVKIRRRRTFDSSATPKIGEKRIEPTAFAKIDLEALGKEIAATVQRAKENDPAVLKAALSKAKAHIGQLEDKIQKHRLTEPEIRRVLVLDAGAEELLRFTGQQLKLAHDDFQRIEKAIAANVEIIKHKISRSPKVVVVPVNYQTPALPKSTTVMNRAKEMIDEERALSACERAILAAAATRYPKASSRSQLSVISGYSIKSSSFANALSALRTGDLISGYGDAIELTAKGVAIAPPSEPMDGEAVRRLWLGKLGQCEKRILEVMIHAYPNAVPKEDISGATGYSITSSSFANALSKLRTLELITRGSEIRASETLFG